MRTAVVVMFRNEERHLPTLLESLASQTRFPGELLLVDDGSVDASVEIASQFAACHDGVRVLHNLPQPPARDWRRTVPICVGFQWAIEQLDGPYDVVAKLDADLKLGPRLFEDIEARFAADPSLGLTGPYLSEERESGRMVRLRGRPEHVNGAVKFYRRACYDVIAPLPPLPSWDMVDEVKARMNGWRTESFSGSDGDAVHLRPMGQRAGSLRAYRYWGLSAYVTGSHPLLVLYMGLRHLADRPRVLGALNYLVGWAGAAVQRVPRFDEEIRAFRRREQRERMRRRVAAPVRRALGRRAPTT